MKSTKTDAVIIGGALLYLLWEGYTLINNEERDTISERIWRASRRPLVPFLGGMLMGHFFWQAQDEYEEVEVEEEPTGAIGFVL